MYLTEEATVTDLDSAITSMINLGRDTVTKVTEDEETREAEAEVAAEAATTAGAGEEASTPSV